MSHTDSKLGIQPSGFKGARIAFIQASWHTEIVDRLRDAFLNEMPQLGYPESSMDTYRVPGSFEIPLHAKRLAQSDKYSAIVAAGFVVDGGIYRHEFVAASVVDALMRVQLETNIPILSAILVPQNFHEHDDHKAFFLNHFAHKGVEVARACAETIRGLGKIPGWREDL